MAADAKEQKDLQESKQFFWQWLAPDQAGVISSQVISGQSWD